MRIKSFTALVTECAKPHRLKDCDLVVDAQNFFYDCYEKSTLTCEFGAESDQYAAYLKRYLNMFKRANIKCYFIFKGGTINLEKKIYKDQNLKVQKLPSQAKSFNPIFMSDIHLQVLKEMGFDYVFSEFEAKPHCVALAKKLSCAVLAMDVEFALAGVAYVSNATLCYNEHLSVLDCKLFLQNNLLEKFQIDRDKLALFVVLTDLTIFPEDYFADYFKYRNLIPKNNNYHIRNQRLLALLSKNTFVAEVGTVIYRTRSSKKVIHDELDKARKLVSGVYAHVDDDFVYRYIFHKHFSDPERWFPNGVAAGYIAKPYIDLYRSNVLLVTGQVGEDGTHPIELSLNIIKYAYDLLTNFKNNGLKYLCNHQDPKSVPRTLTGSVAKPFYSARECVFESGWDRIRSLSLFEHFMIEEIRFRFDRLDTVPEDAKLLLMALAYFHHKRSSNTTKIACSVIMCYVKLGVVNVTVNKNIDRIDERDYVSMSDCKMAAKLMEDYCNVDITNFSSNVELLDALFEFQCCLREINYLNKLCGALFEPTIYSNTYNGTVVCKFLHVFKDRDERSYIDQIFKTTPTVLNFVNNVIEQYKKLTG